MGLKAYMVSRQRNIENKSGDRAPALLAMPPGMGGYALV